MWYSVVWYITISWKICSAEKWHPVDVSFVTNTEISPKLGNLLGKQKGLPDASFLLATKTLCNRHKHLDIVYDGIIRANQSILLWAQWPHQLQAESLFNFIFGYTYKYINWVKTPWPHGMDITTAALCGPLWAWLPFSTVEDQKGILNMSKLFFKATLVIQSMLE